MIASVYNSVITSKTKAATDLKINGSILLKRKKILDLFVNDFIKKFVAKRIIQSANKVFSQVVTGANGVPNP